MPHPLSFDPPVSADPRGPEFRLRIRVLVRSAFLAALAALALARVVPLPQAGLLPLAITGLLLYGAIAAGLLDAGRALTWWVPALDMGLLYVLVAYTPVPQSWGALAYVWLAGQALISRGRRPARMLALYAAAVWLTLALASLHMGQPVAYMAGHTVALLLFAGIAEAFLRERRESSLDPLTGALDRRAGLIELERRLDRGLPFQVAVVDVRDFKRINDTFGHVAGDQALRIIGRRLHHALRTGDAIIRYGGDEFVVASELSELRERVQHAFEEPLRTRFGTFVVSADIGVMRWRPGLTLSEILVEADRRMYATKRAG